MNAFKNNTRTHFLMISLDLDLGLEFLSRDWALVLPLLLFALLLADTAAFGFCDLLLFKHKIKFFLLTFTFFSFFYRLIELTFDFCRRKVWRNQSSSSSFLRPVAAVVVFLCLPGRCSCFLVSWGILAFSTYLGGLECVQAPISNTIALEW